MFLETEASFPYCNWSTKMAGIIWLGSTSVQHVNNWQRLSRLPFLSLCKSRKFLETKTYSFISIKMKIICKKNFKNIWCKYGLHKYLPQAQQHLAPLPSKCWGWSNLEYTLVSRPGQSQGLLYKHLRH